MAHPVNRIELAKSGYGNCGLKNLKGEKYKRFACPEGCGPGNEGAEGKAIAKVRGAKSSSTAARARPGGGAG